MFFRKPKRDTLSEIFGSGSDPNAGNGADGISGEPRREADPLEVLRGIGINTDLIPDSLLPTIASSFAMAIDNPNEIAKIKVECGACNRPVAYGRGKCMYCGKPLELPESVRAQATTAGDNPGGETSIDFDLGGSL
jgi:hypothetical protein